MTTWQLAALDWNLGPEADCWQLAVDLKLAGVELGVYDPSVELSAERVASLPTSVPVTGMLLALPVDRWPDGALSGDVDRLTADVAACADVCRQLGLTSLGLWPGADAVGTDVVEGVRRAVAAAGEVRIALEYQPGTAVASSLDALWLCDQVEGLGVLLDTGHAYVLGEDPAVVVEQLGDRLLRCHLSDADLGGAEALPCGRVHDLTNFVTALDALGWHGTAAFHLTGGIEAVRESRDHILSRRV